MHATRIIIATALLLVVAGIVAKGRTSRLEPARKSSGSQAGTAGDRFVVHEWGTFTSFSGSDSVDLEFRPLVDNDLPGFVLNRGTQSGQINFGKSDYRAFQRMETPVTYFYSDRARQVSVRVGFPQGLLTEFFPPVKQMQPAFQWGAKEPLANSMLDWGKVWILPTDRLRPDVGDANFAAHLQARMLDKLLPSSAGFEHYAYARDTDSALVYVAHEAESTRPIALSGSFFEKFLFYRGIGNFKLPLKLMAHSDGNFELTNTGPEAIRSLFRVTVDGDQLRFAKHDEIGAGERLALKPPQVKSTVGELSDAVTQSLIDERLYEKEARAMVNTWRTSWFGEQGTRLFYLLPQSTTDKLLPLTIVPQPNETVRVMVGRLEIMTPHDEAKVLDLVRQSAADHAKVAEARKENPELQHELPPAIIELGRLAEPALVRAKRIAKDRILRYEADQLLRQLQQHREADGSAG